MPLYDYECPECGLVFEMKQSFDDEAVADCPQCQSASRRMFTPVPIIFKGSGFYITDHRKDSRPSTSKSPTTAKPASDAKPGATVSKADTSSSDASRS
jgi:putative FmdB family regulatory protein